MAKWTSKPWGRTQPLLREEFLHADLIEVEPGGYCSIHRHASKANVFHVQSGVLMVRQFVAQNAPGYARTLCAGEARSVAAGIWHQFWCFDKCTAIEVYLPPGVGQLVDAEDIERHPACKKGAIAVSSMRLDELWAKAFGEILAGAR